jgi:long-subunit fatty acid transport protein
MWVVLSSLFTRPADAYSMAGFGVPCVGGSLANNAAIGAFGLPYNPAAAWTPGPDFASDIGSIYTSLTQELDEWEGPETSGGFSLPIPYLGYATPVGPFGLGFDVIVPYARLGGRDPEGPQRYHTISGTFVLAESDISLAWAPSANWTFGGSFRIGRYIQSSTRSMDLGALLNSMSPDIQAPLGDPFLEGAQTLSHLSDVMFGGAGGLRYTANNGFGVQLALRPGWTAHAKDGLVTVQPSRDLSALIEGDLEIWIRFPSHAYLSATVPVGDTVTFIPQVGVVRWSEANSISVIHDFSLTSTDAVFDALLEKYGLSEATFLDNSEPSASDLGMRDVWNVGLTAQVDVSDGLRLQGVVDNEPAALPNLYVTPGNLDFGALRTGLAGIHQSRKWLRYGGSFDYFFVRNRNVTDSVMSLENKASSGRMFPSGNGRYSLDLLRVAVMIEVAR